MIWVALILALAAGPNLAEAPAAGIAGYGDVESDRYYTKPVQWAVTSGIVEIPGLV